jgi:uncharacterized protein involved in exopolysaccharide biosynthesis
MNSRIDKNTLGGGSLLGRRIDASSCQPVPQVRPVRGKAQAGKTANAAALLGGERRYDTTQKKPAVQPDPAPVDPAVARVAQTEAFLDETVAADFLDEVEAARPVPSTHDAFQHAAPVDDQQWRPLIDPSELISAIYRFRYLIVFLTLIGAAVGVATALSIPKVYYSNAEILVDPRDLKLLDRELTSSNLPFDASLALVENQLQIITSRTVIGKLVDKLHLDDDTEFNGQRGPIGVLGTISELLRGGASDAASEAVRRSETIDKVYKRVGASRGEKTFIVNVFAGSEHPEKAALIANTLTQIYIDFQAELQSDTTVQANEELSGRLTGLREEVETAERKVQDFRAENDLVDAQGRLISDEDILKLNEQLSAARARTIALNARAASISGITPDRAVEGGLPEEVASSLLNQLRTQYSSLKQSVDVLSAKLGPRHPQLQAAESQLESARREIAAEIRRVSSAIQVDLRRAVQTEQDLASGLATLKARRSDAGDEIVKLRELEREAAARRAVYEAFLLRARETGEQSNISTANIRMISRAEPALKAVGTSRKIVAIGGTAAGFGLGIMIAALNVVLNGQKIRKVLDSRTLPQRPAPVRTPPATPDRQPPRPPRARREDIDETDPTLMRAEQLLARLEERERVRAGEVKQEQARQKDVRSELDASAAPEDLRPQQPVAPPHVTAPQQAPQQPLPLAGMPQPAMAANPWYSPTPLPPVMPWPGYSGFAGMPYQPMPFPGQMPVFQVMAAPVQPVASAPAVEAAPVQASPRPQPAPAPAHDDDHFYEDDDADEIAYLRERVGAVRAAVLDLEQQRRGR